MGEDGLPGASEEADAALLALLRWLSHENYVFVTPTPATHRRVVARPGHDRSRTIRDIFGWSLPFHADLLPQSIVDMLRRAGMLEEREGLLFSRLRVSGLGGNLYLHSAFPTLDEDSVFFGPDSYRFANLVTAELARHPVGPGATIADIGTGAGIGAIVAGNAHPQACVIATDVNPWALRLARINARAAGAVIKTVEGSGLQGIDTGIDLAMLNPPYILDEQGRTYRDGGGMHGGAVSLDLTVEAMDRLAPGGRTILYTGSAIIDGKDSLAAALAREVDRRGFDLRYHEIDPDVFGEELAKPPYRDVERIALVSAIVMRPL